MLQTIAIVFISLIALIAISEIIRALSPKKAKSKLEEKEVIPPKRLIYFSENAAHIGAECSSCHKVLKIPSSIAKKDTTKIYLTRSIKCLCGLSYSSISLNGQNTSNGVKCPKCYSTSLTANKKGFGAGKAVAGALLLGPVGIAGGAIGSKKVIITCLNCGHQWNH